MHDIMVKPLPPQCRLTAIFDVSWVHFRPSPTNPLTTLIAVLSFWDVARFVHVQMHVIC